MENLYESDFYSWTKSQCHYLEKGNYGFLDIKNLIEELDSLGKSERRAIKSSMVVLIMHLLKLQYQPEKATNSWNYSIRNSQLIIKDTIEDSPSLRRYPDEILDDCYERAKQYALVETGLQESVFPRNCPWTIDELLKER